MLIDSVDVNKFVREKFLKRLEDLSIKSLGQIPILEQLNEEQAEWTKKRMKSGSWNK